MSALFLTSHYGKSYPVLTLHRKLLVRLKSRMLFNLTINIRGVICGDQMGLGRTQEVGDRFIENHKPGDLWTIYGRIADILIMSLTIVTTNELNIDENTCQFTLR